LIILGSQLLFRRDQHPLQMPRHYQAFHRVNIVVIGYRVDSELLLAILEAL